MYFSQSQLSLFLALPVSYNCKGDGEPPNQIDFEDKSNTVEVTVFPYSFSRTVLDLSLVVGEAELLLLLLIFQMWSNFLIYTP